MDRKIRSWRMVWTLAVLGMVAVTAHGVAEAQSTALPEGSYRLAALPTETGQGAGQGTPPPVKDDLFAGTEEFAKGASSVTQIDLDPQSLDEVGGRDAAKARNTVLSVVHTYSYDKPGMYNVADVQKFRQKLETGDWHCSVHTYEEKSGDSTDVCSRHRTDGLQETAIITVSPKSLTFIHTIRRKHAGEPTGFLRMDSLGDLSALAALDPQEFMDMQMAMSHLHMLDNAEMKARMDAAMQNLHTLDLPEMQKKMDEAMQGLKEAQKEFKLDQRQLGLEDAEPKHGQPKQPE